MYNRYIPQPDGSYRRNRMPEPNQTQQPQRRQPEPQPCPAPPPEPPKPEPTKQLPCAPQRRPCGQHRPQRPPVQEQKSQADTSISNFLKRLLPKDFDTGDLLIVLLLLLMAGDSCDDQNTALLTLALYFFM